MFEHQKFVEKIIVERNKVVEDAIFGEINKIATENGIDTYITINEKVVIKALERQIPKKVRADEYGWCCCPCCDDTFKLLDNFHKRNPFCGNCGQALDWSDT